MHSKVSTLTRVQVSSSLLVKTLFLTISLQSLNFKKSRLTEKFYVIYIKKLQNTNL